MVKGQVGNRNVEHTLGAVFRLGKQELSKIGPKEWQAAIRESTRSEEFYAKIDKLFPSPEEQVTDQLPQEPNDLEEQSSTEENQPESCENPFVCQICKVDFKASKAFTNHTKNYAICSACPKTFCGAQRENNLKGHFKKEHDIKPKTAHICQFCKKAFQYQSRLKHHLVRTPCGRQELPKN